MSKDGKNDSWKQKYGPKSLRTLEYQPVKVDTKPLLGENKLDLKQTMQLKPLQPNETQKPLWVKLSKGDFRLLIKDVAKSLDDDNYCEQSRM